MTAATVTYTVTSDGKSDQFENSSSWGRMIANVDFVDFNKDGDSVHSFEVYAEDASAFERLLDTDSTVISYKAD